MKWKYNYVMRRLDTTKKVTLLFRISYAKYARSQLPDNVITKRKYKRRAAPNDGRRKPVRKEQRGRAFLSS